VNRRGYGGVAALNCTTIKCFKACYGLYGSLLTILSQLLVRQYTDTTADSIRGQQRVMTADGMKCP
jgi:hypothetical protein